MGLRGPGAKPVKKPAKGQSAQVASVEKRRRPKWQSKKLSRSERVIAFVESLKITSGTHAGKPFRLRDWQKDIIRAIYDPTTESGLRAVRTALVTFPRKNGKTQLAAGLAMAHLCGPEAEPRGQVYSAAVDRNQAALIYREMRAFIDADEALSERVIVRDFSKTLEDTETGTVYQALSADARSKHGFSASAIVADEVAQWPSRELWDVLTTSTAARAEPLAVAISTQSSDPHGIMAELTQYGRQVRDGIIEDPSFHATIYEAAPEADIWDEATWYAANPALGDFRSLDEMRAYAAQAKRIPAREATFRNLYLNQAVDAEERWIPAAEWDACAAPFDLAELRGAVAYGGLDLGSTRDLTSLALWFPEAGVLASWSWIPEASVAEREERDRIPLRAWRDRGLIETTPGKAVNRRHLAMRVAEIVAPFDLRKVAYDRWRIEDLQAACGDEGIDLPLAPYGQGYKDMAPAVEAFETLVLNGQLRHGGNPVLAWALSNVAMDQDPTGARKPNKERSLERIDPIAAALMAVGIWSKEPSPQEVVAEVFFV